jgi:hypothetical protein
MTTDKSTPVKKKRTRSYTLNDIYAWKFKPSDMPKQWVDHLGVIDSRFLMYVDGEPGNGKTEYIMQFCKMLCVYIGKTRLNNVEQGKHTQIQQSAMRNKFKETIPPGKGLFQYDNIRVFDEFVEKIKKQNSGHVIIIDSISYWPLTPRQIKYLIATFKKKSFVFVGYKAHFGRNQAIIHDCDIKVRIENFIAHVTGSRFGGDHDYYIWPEKYSIRSEATGDLFKQQRDEEIKAAGEGVVWNVPEPETLGEEIEEAAENLRDRIFQKSIES